MNGSAKISPAQRVAALKALEKYDPFHGAFGVKRVMSCRLDGEYQYVYCTTAFLRWHVDSFIFPIDHFDLSPMSERALLHAQSLFAKYDNENDKDFPVSIGEFKRTYATGPLKECSPSEAFSLGNKRLNPRLLSRVLYAICSHENRVPMFRSCGNAAQPVYLCGDLGEAVLCPLRPME